MSNYFTYKKNKSYTDEKYVENELPNTWFIETPIDLEYRYYKLKAYIQRLKKNCSDGYIFNEFITLEARYKDLESFLNTSEIVHEDKESKKLFKYIYNLPETSTHFQEIINISKMGMKELKDVYLDVISEITNVYNHTKILRVDISDKRKNINVYVEKCNCGIWEHYIITKSGTVKECEITEKDPLFNKENIIVIKTSKAMNTIGSIIPFTLKRTSKLIQ